MEALENLTCREFCSRLASSDPTPGGGGFSLRTRAYCRGLPTS